MKNNELRLSDVGRMIPQGGIRVERLTHSLYRLILTTGYEMNLVASVGAAGTLLVDAGFPDTAAEVSSLLAALGGGPLRYLVNTHEHYENALANRHFAADATIVAQVNVARRLSGAYYWLPPLDDVCLPHITFADSLSLTFNGEDVRLVHIPGGHTDGDCVVHFTKSKVVALGDLVFSDQFPYADLRRGGNALRYVDNIESMLTWLPTDVLLVAGHGRTYTVDDLRRYHGELRRTVAVIRPALEAGKTPDDIVGADLLGAWRSWGTDFINVRHWVNMVAKSLTVAEVSGKPSICEPLTRILKEDGIEAAAARYARLREVAIDRYDFGERELNTLGYQLLNRKRMAEALTIFRLNLDAFPTSDNAYDSYAEALAANGETAQAVENCRQALQLNPGNINIREMLLRLTGGQSPDTK